MAEIKPESAAGFARNTHAMRRERAAATSYSTIGRCIAGNAVAIGARGVRG
jgi:hypothetical protein